MITHFYPQRNHIRGMEANYGGTELEAALQKVFAERNRLMPTMVFVLTDGQVRVLHHFCYGVLILSPKITQPDPVLLTVRIAMSQATPDAPLRIFSLGIGNYVTTEVVEGIAREGHGECLFAVKSEAIIGKCSKLLRAGRSSFVEGVSIDWGISERRQDSLANSRATFSVDLGPLHVELQPPPMIQQMPHQITKIYPGTRFVVFALTTQKRIPREVTLRGQLNGGDGLIEKKVPVSHVKVFNKTDPGRLIHTLAARRLITELTEERAPLPIAVDPTTSAEDVRKAAIVRLGIEYQLASRYTSFVAVDDGRDPHSTNRHGRRRSRSPARSGDDQTMDAFAPFSSRTVIGSALNFGLSFVAFMSSALFRYLDGGMNTYTRRYTRRPPGAYSSSSSSSSSLAPGPIDSHSAQEEEDEDSDSTDTLSTLSSLESSISDWYSERRRRRPPTTQGAPRSPTPDIQGQDPDPTGADPQQQQSSAPPPPVPAEVLELVHLLHSDGRFPLDDALGRIVGHEALRKPADIQADDALWATALAVAYLQKHLALNGQRDLLDGLLDKVMESIDGTMRAEFEMWVSRASSLVL